MEFPVLRVALDFFVNRVAMFEHAADERVGEQPRLGLLGGRRRQFEWLAPVRRAFFLVNGGGALRIPEFLQRPLQILRRIQVVLKQKLHGAFARFTSFAHESNSKG